MAKRVFFSFHYQDVADFRANVVRNHWISKPDREDAGYFDASIWETARRQGDVSLKRLINEALQNTSNTCVLIGSQTYARPWVRYEILKSFIKGNYIFGVHINGIKDKYGNTKSLGPNPFDYIGATFSDNGETITLWETSSGEWVRYDKIENSASHTIPQVSQEFRGKGFKLSSFYNAYDWILEDGYRNFSSWVK